MGQVENVLLSSVLFIFNSTISIICLLLSQEHDYYITIDISIEEKDTEQYNITDKYTWYIYHSYIYSLVFQSQKCVRILSWTYRNHGQIFFMREIVEAINTSSKGIKFEVSEQQSHTYTSQLVPNLNSWEIPINQI